MATSPVTDKLRQRSAVASIHKYTPVQLGFWPEERRAIANELARCALFRCGDKKRPRQQFSNEPLFVLGSGGVTYTGEELRGFDEDVFLGLIHAARSMPADSMVVKISNAQICTLTGRRQSQHYYTEIYRSIHRMKGGVITVLSARLTRALACQEAREEGASPEVLERLYAELADFDRREEQNLLLPSDTYSGLMMSLIDGDAAFTNGNGKVDNIPQGNLQWSIQLNRKLVTLFADSYLTLIDFDARKDLSPGARRLQAYFCSHRKPNDVLVQSLSSYLGLEVNKRDQARLMQRYLDELVAAGVLASGVIVPAAEKGEKLVRVTRPVAVDNPPPGA